MKIPQKIYFALLTCLLLIHADVIARQEAIYTGTVVDSTTRQPIPFVHVVMKDAGVITNQGGSFSLRYNPSDKVATVRISCVGYKTKLLPLSRLLEKNVIALIVDVTVLPEVFISDMTAQAILKKSEKRGFQNYVTSRYIAEYIIDRSIFYDGADSAVATSREIGMLMNQSFDTTGVYPKFFKTLERKSPHFIAFDTIGNELSMLTQKRNSVSAEMAISFDPVRIALRKEFHPVPALFSTGFYEQTDMDVVGAVMIDGNEYYLITVAPKAVVANGKLSREDEQRLAQYRASMKDMAKKAGRVLSDRYLDSLFYERIKSRNTGTDVSAVLLVDMKSYAIVHAIIKVSTFDASGALHSKMHVGASYTKLNDRYVLQNLDILLKRTPPPGDDRSLYYVISLQLSNYQTKKLKDAKSAAEVALFEDGMRALNMPLSADMVRMKDFLLSTKNCAQCQRNSWTVFGRGVR